MRYVFILGRNILLSTEEVYSYLKRNRINKLESEINKNGLFIKTDKEIPKNAIASLGGVIGIGKVINDIESSELFFGKDNKLNYILWNFSSPEVYEEYSDYLKVRFKKEKLKATEKKLSGKMNMQSGKKYGIASSKLIHEQYFIFDRMFGRVIQECDYKKIEERDMKKPVRRQELSISPRLSKIMINLSEINPDKSSKLLDSFCGIGVILTEALLQDLDVIGIDIDDKAIEGAKKNLKWMGFDRKKYKLMNQDSKKAYIQDVDVMVSEPDLGKILKKIPQEDNAKRTLKKFEKLMIAVINNIKKKVKGNIVFTAPLIKTHKARLSCNIDNICDKTSKNLIKGGFQDFRKGQIVGREIFVLA